MLHGCSLDKPGGGGGSGGLTAAATPPGVDTAVFGVRFAWGVGGGCLCGQAGLHRACCDVDAFLPTPRRASPVAMRRQLGLANLHRTAPRLHPPVCAGAQPHTTKVAGTASHTTKVAGTASQPHTTKVAGTAPQPHTTKVAGTASQPHTTKVAGTASQPHTTKVAGTASQPHSCVSLSAQASLPTVHQPEGDPQHPFGVLGGHLPARHSVRRSAVRYDTQP